MRVVSLFVIAKNRQELGCALAGEQISKLVHPHREPLVGGKKSELSRHDRHAASRPHTASERLCAVQLHL